VLLNNAQLEAGDIKDITVDPGLYVCLKVIDTGIGMNRSTIGRIFDPYFTTKESGKGTGLGLSLVHGIVKNHGGHISVYSEPGKGTEFHVYLPVIARVETRTIEKGSERVLLIDDNKDVLEIEKQMLEHLGYQVTARIGSLEALALFRSKPDGFDLVITDLTMPNMTGDRLAEEMMRTRFDIPIILCTGFSETMSAEKAKSLGVKGFLMKPVVIGDLSSMIREVLDNE
jgi:CheY-like chemotaxis protein